MISIAAWTCLLAPLAATVLIAVFGNLLPRPLTGLVATGATAVSFIAAIVALAGTLGHSASDRTHITTAFTWLSTQDYNFKLALQIDPLSLIMMLVVSGVGMLIIGYSIGYMRGESEERRYFAYIAFFVFSMLMLVESANFLILLIGWGLVGLSSYLLIGFWHERPSAVAAAKKAFIMNAVGDVAMMVAIFLIIQHAGVLDFNSVFTQWPLIGMHHHWVTDVVVAGLLVGALAKSAQIPLHTWLPDAMEGPTPVSALIHAATMVTAGVFLIVRVHPLFELAPHVQDVAAGIGAYSAAMFHLVTHAFFKALLFLGAGVVIHALGGEQDMRKMGGLRKRLPRTYIAMFIGAAALAGLPPLAGFFSKDAILALASSDGLYGKILLTAGLAGVVLTALYSFRMIFLVFSGEARSEGTARSHAAGEGPRWMTVPVAVLALLALTGGWLEVAGLWHPFSTFLEPVVALPRLYATATREWILSATSIALSLGGIWIARSIYATRRHQAPRAPRLLTEKLYFDRAYDLAFYRPAVVIAHWLGSLFERPLIDGSVAGIGLGASAGGRLVAALQNGLARSYALAVAAGAVIALLLFLLLR